MTKKKTETDRLTDGLSKWDLPSTERRDRSGTKLNTKGGNLQRKNFQRKKLQRNIPTASESEDSYLSETASESEDSQSPSSIVKESAIEQNLAEQDLDHSIRSQGSYMQLARNSMRLITHGINEEDAFIKEVRQTIGNAENDSPVPNPSPAKKFTLLYALATNNAYKNGDVEMAKVLFRGYVRHKNQSSGWIEAQTG